MDSRPWERSEIAERFKALRRKAILSQSHLGRIIRISRQTISEIENVHVMPHPSTWNRFCELEARHNQPRMDLPEHWL